jgi:hypothetical protein
MNIITNQKKINRNARVGYWASISSPTLLMISAFTLYKYPDQVLLSMVLFLLGTLSYGVGMSFRKYSRREETVLNQVLKKLGKEYSLYHFISPVSHLLVGPVGIWILVPKLMRGIVTYNEKRKKWQLSQDRTSRKVFSFMNEGIGDPKRDILTEAEKLDRYLRKHWTLEEKPNVQAALVIFHPEAVVEADNAPIPTVHATKLRAFIRDQEKTNSVSNTALREINQLFAEKEKQNEEAKTVDSEDDEDTD